LASSVDPGDRRPPHRVAQAFFFGAGAAALPPNVWHSEGGYYNDVFIDILLSIVEGRVVYLATADNSAASGRVPRQPTTRMTLPEAVF